MDKHYLRKEHLLFPYLEKHGITGPPKVMWSKHDEARALLRGALDALKESGVPLGRLVDHLRVAAGLSPLGIADEGAESAAGPRPDWAAPGVAARTHDAREAIASGRHPMAEVMRDLSQLRAGEVYELVTPFVPAPLIEMAGPKGFEAHAVTEGPELVRTYIRRTP